MKIAYLIKTKVIKKNFWGNETKNSFVKVKILGERIAGFEFSQTRLYLIELPNKKKIEVGEQELFTKGGQHEKSTS